METTTTKLTIDSGDIESIKTAISDGVATPETMANWLYSLADGHQYAVCEGGILILEPETWHADDGNAVVVYKDSTAQDAAEEYVSDGDWGDDGGSVQVRVWMVGINGNGEVIHVDEECMDVDIPINHDAKIRKAV